MQISPLEDSFAQQWLNKLSKKNQSYVVHQYGYLGGAYIADVTNSHTPQLIFKSIDSTGTWGSETFIAFQKHGDNWEYLGEPPKSKSKSVTADGPFYFHGYFNVLAKKEEVLTKICGKTYISFESGVADRLRDTFIWEKGELKDACDINWANYEYQSFKMLHRKGLYAPAYNQLGFYLRKCKDRINSATYLTMLNDLALTSLKSKPGECSDILNKIEKNPSYAEIPLRLKNSIANTKSLCQQKIIQISVFEREPNKDQLKWVLQWRLSNLDSANEAASLTKLLTLTVPPGPTFKDKNIAEEGLVTALFQKLTGMTDRNVLENRYVVLSGCSPHDCATRGFVWIDTQTGTSVVGIIEMGDAAYITSKNFTPANTPSRARKDIMNLYKVFYWDKDSISGVPVYFFDFEKKIPVSLPAGWLASTK